MKKMACSAAVILMLIVFQHNSFAQVVFPGYGIFEKLEKLIGTDLVAIQEKEKKQPLTRAELNTYLSISNEAGQIMDADWQSQYLGYIKRVQAKLYFNDAILISHQPSFYRDTALMHLALRYIDAGQRALNKYNPSIYPPSIVVNTSYTDGRPTSTTRQSVFVDETGVKNLRVEIAAAQGNVAAALKELYTLWGDNKQLFKLGNHDNAFTYATAHRILQYNRLLEQYDDRLVNFCMSLLVYNTSGNNGSFREGDDLKNWNLLKADIMETLDLVIGKLDSSKKFNFIFPDKNFYNRNYDWLLLIISRFDDKEALGEVGNRFGFINYAIDIANSETNTDISARAARYAQKHFSWFVTDLHQWDLRNQCDRAKWITTYMDKYGITDDERKYIAKVVKKCSKLKGY